MPTHHQPGTVLAGRFRLERLLGEGAFGQVWRAAQLPLNRAVAVKLLKLSGDRLMQKRFDYEARALATISHPNCVTLYDFGHAEGTSYLVTELVEGQELRQWLSSGQRSVDEILDIARQVAGALVAAHANQVVHRDLKPENVMLSHDPQRGLVVKVLDFGLSKIMDDERRDVTKTGEIFGTPGYMSPEMLRGAEISGATDQYSFGVMLYEMLEGHPPFVAATGHEVCMMHLLAPVPPLNPGVPPDVSAFVQKLLRKEPSERFRTTKQMLVAIEALGAGGYTAPEPQPRRAAPTELQGPAQPPNSTANVPWAVAAVLAVVVVMLLGFVAVTWNPTEPAAPPPQPMIRVSPLAPAIPSGAKATVDAAPDSEHAEPERGSLGCGTRRAAGTQTLSRLDGLQTTRVLVHVPKGYDPDRPHSVLVVLHESWQTAVKTLRDANFAAGADKHGFIVVAPGDDLMHSWATPESWDRAWGTLDLVAEELCIDRDALFAFGFGAGGWAAENIACRFDDVRAIATHAHRFTTKEQPCALERPVPYLYMAPLKDGWDPVEGGGSECPTGAVKWPMRDHEKVLIEQRACGAKHVDRTRYGASECYSHDDCTTPLRVCHIEAGRFWPGLPRSIGQELCDRGPAKDFPYDDVLWEFLLQHLPTHLSPK